MSIMSLAQPSWQSYLRAILAIARKDLLHFLRYPLNAIFQVLHPLIWITPVYFLGQTFVQGQQAATGFAAYVGTADYMSFILIGTVLSHYVATVFWGIGFSLKTEMDQGVLESNWMTPNPRLLMLGARTIAAFVITTITDAVFLVIAAWLFGFHASGDVVAAVLTVLPTILALYGFGFAFAAIVLLMRDANTMVDITQFMVSQLSGTQYPVQVLPWWLLPLALALPLTYGFDAVRAFLLGTTTLLPLAWELVILVAFMIVMITLGAWIFARVERICRQRGTLSMH
ncbi:MAG: ABC transporter permease [Anaerolineae bacterium]|nr:ABC transporter permease [Anaerolineae bacterium]